MHLHISFLLCSILTMLPRTTARPPSPPSPHPKLPPNTNTTTTTTTAPIPRNCGTGPLSPGLRSAHQFLHAQQRLRPRQAPPSASGSPSGSLSASGSPSGSPSASASAAGGPIVVETYFHLVTTQDQEQEQLWSGEWVADAIANQATTLNKAYQPANITFATRGITYSANDTWATAIADPGMTSALRTGGYAALNIYLQTNLSTAPGSSELLLGTCALPVPLCAALPCPLPSSFPPPSSSSSIPPSTYTADGCHVLASTLPSPNPVPQPGYALGLTAVHEVGHWFGLLHTFEGETCAPGDEGDWVDDTRQEGGPTSGCPGPGGKSSCVQGKGGGGVSGGGIGGVQVQVGGGVGVGGEDPVHDFMDYSDDECYEGFTPDQNARMVNMFRMLRQGY